MTRIIETAKGNYKLLAGENKTIAVNTIDNNDIYEFDENISDITDDDVRIRIEETIIDSDFDAEFLNDDFSWVKDFEQW